MTYRKKIDLARISDLSRRKSEKIGVVGITPFFTDSLDFYSLKTKESKDITRSHMSWVFDKGGLSIGEQLYSAGGS
jgi:hypothetical protein